MLERKIKREHSPEQPPSTTPEHRRGAIAKLFAPSPTERQRDDNPAHPPLKYTPRPLPLRVYQDSEQQCAPAKVKSKPTDKHDAVTARSAPATDRELQPHDDRLVGARHASGWHGTSALPATSWLSSDPVPATNKTLALTKTYHQHNTFTRQAKPYSDRPLISHRARFPRTKNIQRVATMDNFSFGSGNGLGGGADMNFTDFDAYTGVQDYMVTLPLQELRDLQREVNMQKAVMVELFTGSQNMRIMMQRLEERVGLLEQNNAPSSTLLPPSTLGVRAPLTATADTGDIRDDSGTGPFPSKNDRKATTKAPAKRSVATAFTGESTTLPGRTKHRKKLQLKIPETVPPSALGAGIPTPMLSASQTAPPTALAASFPTTPRTPYTPGKIGPSDSYKKTVTSISKRKIHDLNKSMPPLNVQLPMVPLTDAEVVVYFFNSLSNPIVSLRLYARGWSPASIVQCLNNHREVDPPYLRNTCSVKCTTAIKLGRKIYGPDWEEQYRAVFTNAEDPKATDLIRADVNDTIDYDIRALGAALKKHPSGEEAGIFTECVKYCIENNARYTMSNVFQLAIDLQDGNVPQHPATPTLDELEGDSTEDEDPPSPLAERIASRGRTDGCINFTAVNTKHEEYDEVET